MFCNSLSATLEIVDYSDHTQFELLSGQQVRVTCDGSD